MKLALVGNYGATNRGDDAIMQSILGSHPGHEWTVFSANPVETEGQFGVRAVAQFPLGIRSMLRHGFLGSMRALKSVDAVVLGGGGLFQDKRLFACFLWSWQVWWARHYGKPVFAYANGVGPLRTSLGRRLARWAFGYASGITVRDSESRRLLHEIGVDPRKIEVAADPVMLMKPEDPEPVREPKTYAISLRPFSSSDQNTLGVFTEALLRLKAEKGAKFKFISMQGIREHDSQLLAPLAQRFGSEIVSPANFKELMGLLARCEFAIGMRYHFLIAALLTGTPALAISYSPKVDSLYEGDLIPYKISVEELSPDVLEKRLTRLSVEYNRFRAYVRTRVIHLREMAFQNIALLEDFLDKLGRQNNSGKMESEPNDLTKESETDNVSQQ